VNDAFPHYGNGELILVVDDDPAMGRLVSFVLRRYQYKVLISETPREALEHLRAEGSRINLLLTDLVMPEMDGFALIREAIKLQPTLKFLVMTGTFAFKDIQAQAADLGLPEVLQKPIRDMDLLAAVHSALNANPSAGQKR